MRTLPSLLARPALRRSTQGARRQLRVTTALAALLIALVGCTAVAPPGLPADLAAADPTPTVPATLVVSESAAPLPSPTMLPSATSSPSPTATATVTATATPSVTSTATATATATPSATSTATAETIPLTPQPTPTLSSFDELRRGALFDKVWGTVATHYLYADFGGVDWQALKDTYRPRALAASTTEEFYATLAEMIDQLRDDHSRFENPQQAFVQQALATGRDAYVGVGILTVPVDDGLLVTTVFPNSPAAEAQLQRRDMIVAVDGAPVNPDDTGISGPVDTQVQLVVRSPNGPLRTVTMTRRAVRAQYVPEVYLLPDTRVGYVLIQSFWAQDMADKTGQALQALLTANDDQLDGLIVDLRSNGGGWRSVLEGLLSTFVAGDVGAWWSQQTSYPLTITGSPLSDRLTSVPIVVLVDRETESYAEVFAAVLQAQGRAQVVGFNTAGNTETIFAYDLDDASRLWVAQEGFKLPDGSNLEGRGVIPDHAIDVDWTRFSELRDPHILKAIELIGQGRIENQEPRTGD